MAFLRIIRPFNCLFVGITVLFGAFHGNDPERIAPAIYAVVSAIFIAAAGYVINDYFDLPIDRINKPQRILPAEKMKPNTAYNYAIILFLLGISFSFLTARFLCVILAVFNSLILYYYARKFKAGFLIGNLVVAYSAASTFVYGGVSTSNLQNSLLIAGYAFIYTFYRELIKDAEDIEGDAKFKARTLAIVWGRKNVILFSFLPVFLIIGYTFFANFAGFIVDRTFWLLNVLVALPLITFTFFLTKKSQTRDLHLISDFAKLDMIILMIILWVG